MLQKHFLTLFANLFAIEYSGELEKIYIYCDVNLLSSNYFFKKCSMLETVGGSIKP